MTQPTPTHRRRRFAALSVLARSRRVAGRVTAGACGVLALGATLGAPASAGANSETSSLVAPGGAGGQPNIVVVMVDDMSLELLDHIPAATKMIEEGVTFQNYIVSTPLCCPSRATFFAGQYPHVTGVQTNGPQHGGFAHYADERDNDVGYALQQGGYRTGLIGKYLHGYRPEGTDGPAGYERGLVPRGWDEWFVGGAYAGWHYTLTESVDGFPRSGLNVYTHDGETEADYFTDFAGDRAAEFVARAGSQPFALFVKPFASHKGLGPDPDRAYKRMVEPAPRDRRRTDTAPADWTNEFRRGDCGGGVAARGGCQAVTAPDPMWADSFNVVGTNPPSWRADLPRLTTTQQRLATRYTRLRAQSLQAVSDLISRLRQALGTEMDNTYLVFTSDNGFFLGQHRLFNGKGTAYDHDVRVPLVIVPPGGLAEPRTVTAVVQSTDLAPTFAQIADAPLVLPTDGLSLLPFLQNPGTRPARWRDGGLISFLGGNTELGPDRSNGSEIIPSYYAIRTEDYLYVDYTTLDAKPPIDHQMGEFYWLPTDVEQLNNRFDELTTRQRQDLNDALVAYASCAAESCQEADLPEITLPTLD